MHCYRIFLLFLFASVAAPGFAQNVNWRRISPENRHLIYAGAGLNFGAGAAVGYAYRLPVAHSVLVNAEFSSPFGQHVFDDLKTRLGAQTPVWQSGPFAVVVRVAGVFRRYETDFVRLENFGSETGAVIGFYKRRWFVATEVSFDKAITTHVRNSAFLHENYPGIRDGWYIPTGGNFSYGLQAGLSFGKNDLCVSAGKTVTQDFKTAPLFPLYGQIGYSRRF